MFPGLKMIVFASMKLALLFVSSLFFFLEAHGQSFTAPRDDVSDGDNAEWEYPELQPQPKFQYPQYSQQSNSPNRPQPRAAVRDPYCPGNDNRALMCRLVNEYRAKYGLRPVQLDVAVSREAQYWSDQLNLQNACWFLYHDYNYHDRMRARFPGRRFRENAACSGSTGGGAQFILQKWIDSPGHRQNMLTPEWRTIGVGVTNNIWVINFTT
jgi:uncharacterized protein YkwD